MDPHEEHQYDYEYDHRENYEYDYRQYLYSSYRYCKINKMSTNELNFNLLKCILEPTLAKNHRLLSWRFIRTGFNETLRKSTYRIQNCESNEYLVINNSLVDNSTIKYAFTISEENLLMNENQLNSLWVFNGPNTNYLNLISDVTGKYFLRIIKNEEDQEPLVYATLKISKGFDNYFLQFEKISLN